LQYLIADFEGIIDIEKNEIIGGFIPPSVVGIVTEYIVPPIIWINFQKQSNYFEIFVLVFNGLAHKRGNIQTRKSCPKNWGVS
jgi:hypothetical protein